MGIDPSVSQAQLTAATPTIITLVREAYSNAFSDTLDNISTQANVKWSKILINNVPTGVDTDHEPWSTVECHISLTTHNPSYATLKITQKPSWVKPPSSYTAGSSSSLVVAFKDLSCTICTSLLQQKQLLILGVRAKVTCWKEPTCTPPTTTTPTQLA